MRAFYLVALVGDPLMVVLGFLLFRYPQACAKMNARLSHKELHEFDSPKQLAHTKRVGILLMVAGAFSLVSMFIVYVLIPLK
jgi:hypothetical protein